MEEEKVPPEPQKDIDLEIDKNIDDEVADLEEKTKLFTKQDIKDFKKNVRWFLRFYIDVLEEKPEAESYPAFFLPSITMIITFLSILTILFQKILCQYKFYFCDEATLSATAQTWIMGFGLVIAGMIGFYIGLKTSASIFKGTDNFQEITIVGGVFSFPLVLGFFFGWLFSYGTYIVGIFILFIAHAMSVVAMYASLPKIMLLKGISRFLTILISIGCAVLAIGIFFRLLI